MKQVKIGQSVPRIEDHRFVTGAGTYIDDINLDGQAYGVALRSPHAHADILSVDLSEAQALAGVLFCFSGDDWAAEGFGHIPSKSGVRKNTDGTDFREPPRHCMAIGRARHAGEIVAFVVAESRAVGVAALELINVDYQPLPALTDPRAAMAPGAPQIWDDIPGNLCIDWELGDKALTDAAFARADHVVSLELVNNRVTAAPIEPRGAIAAYDAASDSYTLYNATQNVHANRETFAEKILHVPSQKLHHLAPDVGGGFGAKNGVYPEPALLLYAAKKLGRPVKWINDRSESFLSDTHGRDQISRVELALNADGKFLALRTDSIGNLGSHCATIGPFTISGGSARTQGGPYGYEAMHYRGRGVFTNVALIDPYRGAGRPEASFQTERIIEYAARKLGFDPIELRRKNLIPADQLPLKTAMGLDVDCGDFPHVFAQTLAMTRRPGYGDRVAASKARGRARGFAIAPYLECTGGAPKEFAKISFTADGRIAMATGSQSTGMGHETALPQILADHLGVAITDIDFIQADTDATPIGGGHGGSRGLELGGNAVLQVAREVVEQGKAIAGHLFDAAADQVHFADGHFYIPDTNHSRSLREIVDASVDADNLPAGLEPSSMNKETTFERGIISIPNGCHAAEVEIDLETGVIKIDGDWVVDDFGTIVNPMLADGQVMGGIAQGIGQALMEDIRYDPDSGQLLTGS
ncbi:MAG: xanthine dehydrogenase family protein, partial [Rhodospirillales bacterium]|nr:xanthine dehydrogenase family protein [Rhodospirillales bacterium]